MNSSYTRDWRLFAVEFRKSDFFWFKDPERSKIFLRRNLVGKSCLIYKYWCKPKSFIDFNRCDSSYDEVRIAALETKWEAVNINF